MSQPSPSDAPVQPPAPPPPPDSGNKDTEISKPPTPPPPVFQYADEEDDVTNIEIARRTSIMPSFMTQIAQEENYNQLDEVFFRIVHTGLVHDNIRPPLTIPKTISGKEFCKWVIEIGWAIDQETAIRLGKRLQEAGVLHHYNFSHNFEDSQELYRFQYDIPELYNGVSAHHLKKENPEPSVKRTLIQLGSHGGLFPTFGVISVQQHALILYRSYNDKYPRHYLKLKDKQCKVTELVEGHMQNIRFRFTLEVENYKPIFTFCTSTSQELTEWVDALLAEGCTYKSAKRALPSSEIADVIDPTKHTRHTSIATVDGGPLKLASVLENPSYRLAFRSYLTAQMAVENINFIEGTQHLMLVNTDSIRKRVCEFLWDKFIKADAPQAINIPSNIRKQIREDLDADNYSNEVFFTALEVVYKLLESDVYARFVKSQAYTDMLKTQLQDEVISGTFKGKAFDPGQLKSLHVDLLNGQGLGGDKGSNCSPYCVLTVDLKTYRSGTKKDTCNPQWLESFQFQILKTTRCVEVEIFSANLLASDDFLGKIIIPIASAQTEEPKWFDLLSKSHTESVTGKLRLGLSLSYEEAEANDSKLIDTEHKSSLFAGIRSQAAKNRHRFQQDGFDLDLTYITDNVIAMCYPAEGMSLAGVYRNSMRYVQEFLNKRHANCYRVYNLCEQIYPSDRFENRVEHLPFEKHTPPPFQYIPQFCQSVQVWLDQHPHNVVVIHCSSGKGRTGFMASAYLLFANICSQVESALEYFAAARTKNKSVITIPSQIRYLNYFMKYLRMERRNEPRPTERILALRTLRIHGLPQAKQENFSFCVYSGGSKYSSRKRLLGGPIKSHPTEPDSILTFEMGDDGPIIQDDTLIEFWQHGFVGKTRLFWCYINTRFIIHPTLTLHKLEIDNCHKDVQHKQYDDHMKLEFVFDDVTAKPRRPSISSESDSKDIFPPV